MKKSFIIDLGHVPRSGARAYNGRNEYDICQPIARRLQEVAQAEGYKAIYLDYPTKNNKGDLKAVIARANEIADEVDFGISLHADSSSNRMAHGAHMCYFSNAGAILAQCFAPALCALMPGRALKLVHRTNIAVLKQTRPIWTLAELGFVSNINDMQKLTKKIDDIVECLMQGIRAYYALKEKEGATP